MSNIFQWQLHGDGKTLAPGEVVEPDERLTWVRTAGIGAQHVIAMFGATFLVPILTGFDPSTTLFFTAMSTALFLLISRNSAVDIAVKNRVVDGSKPVRIGTRKVAPNMAMTCCAPIPAVRTQVRRSSGSTTSPGASVLPSPCNCHWKILDITTLLALAWGTAFTTSRTTHHSSSRRFCEVSLPGKAICRNTPAGVDRRPAPHPPNRHWRDTGA